MIKCGFCNSFNNGNLVYNNISSSVKVFFKFFYESVNSYKFINKVVLSGIYDLNRGGKRGVM